MITDSFGKSTVAHLISQEHGEDSSWTLTFRRVVKERAVWETNDLVAAGASPRVGDIALESPAEEELLLSVSSRGAAGGIKGQPPASVSLQPLTGEELRAYTEEMLRPLQNVQRGHYVWMWYSYPPAASAAVKKNAKGDINSGVGDTDQPPTVVENLQVLLECVAREGGRMVFKHHLSDRRDAMRQSVLSKDTQYFVAAIGPTGSVGVTDASGRGVVVDAAFFIGADVLGFIRRYLVYKDGTLADLPSCYLYHAGVTLPPPLVYAAEITCVLMGAKPLSMVR